MLQDTWTYPRKCRSIRGDGSNWRIRENLAGRDDRGIWPGGAAAEERCRDASDVDGAGRVLVKDAGVAGCDLDGSHVPHRRDEDEVWGRYNLR